MARISLGSSSVTVVPDFDESSLKVKLDEISRNKAEITARILGDSRDADKTLATFRASADKTIKGIPEAKFTANTNPALLKIVDMRAEIDEVIKNIPSIEPSLDDKKAMAEALVFRAKLSAELKKGGLTESVDVRTDKSLAAIAKLDVEASTVAKHVEDLGGNSNGNGGFFSNLLGNIPVINKLFSGLGTSAEDAGEDGAEGMGELGSKLLTILPIALALIPAVAAVTVEAAGVLAGFTAAGLGAGAFALLAIPAVEKVTGALGDNRAEIAKLPKGLGDAVLAVQGLEGEWKHLSAALEPEVFTLIDKGVQVLAELLPDVVPFADTFATFLGKIADDAKGFAVSSGFKSFLSDLHSMEGPALEAISTGIEHMGGNLGKLLTVMSSKDTVNALNIAFSILDGTIIAVTQTVAFSMKSWDHASQQIANMAHDFDDAWSNVEGWSKDAWRDIAAGENAFDAAMVSATHDTTAAISGTWDDGWRNVVGWTKDGADEVTHVFDDLRSDVVDDTTNAAHAVLSAWDSLFGDLRSAFSGAVSEIAGIWDGLEQDVEKPINFVLSIVSKVDGLLDVIPGVNLPKNLHLAGGGMIHGSGPAGVDSQVRVLAPGELVIPTTHAAAHMAQAKRESIPGMAAGGVVPGNSPSGTSSAQIALMQQQNAKTQQLATGPTVIAELGKGLSDLGSLVTKGAAAAISGLLGSLVNDIPGTGLAHTIAQGLAKSAVSGITGAIQGAAATAAMGPNTGVASGSEIANAGAIFNYLLSTGKFTPVAAAGAVASIGGESAYNPESVGTGGGGIYGATPLPAGMVTGNATVDLDHQLRDLVQFVGANGDWAAVSEMNKQDSVFAAANIWGKDVERYGINDVHAWGLSIAQGLLNNYNASHGPNAAPGASLALHATKPYSTGGVISEPVLGVGLSSGQSYSFGENGTEFVSNQSQVNAAGSQMQPATQVQMMNLLQMTQQLVNLARQNPSALGRKIQNGMGAGANHGAYK